MNILKNNKAFIIIGAAVALIFVGLLIIPNSKKEEDKKDTPSGDTTDDTPVSPANYKNIAKELNNVFYKDKKVDVQISEVEDGLKVVRVNNAEVMYLNGDDEISEAYQTSDYLILVKKTDSYSIAFYRFEDGFATELSSVDYENMTIRSFVLGENVMEITTRRYIDNILYLDDDVQVKYCNKEDLKAHDASEDTIVGSKYKVSLLVKDDLDVKKIEGSDVLVKDILDNC